MKDILMSRELCLFLKISLLISIGEDDESKAALVAAVWVVSQMSLQVAGHDKEVAQAVHAGGFIAGCYRVLGL